MATRENKQSDNSKDLPQAPYLVRRFSITSLVATLITAAILIFLYRQDLLAEYQEIASAENEMVLRHLTSSLAEPINVFVTNEGLKPKALQSNINLDLLFASALDQINERDILKLKIYNLAGTTIYSSVKSEIGRTSTHPNFLEKALGGETVHATESRDVFQGMVGESQKTYVFMTYMPLTFAGERIGVIESYDDAAQVFQRLHTKIASIVVIVLGSFTALYAALFLSVRRADRSFTAWKAITDAVNDKLHHLAFYDALTKLPNRHLLNERLKQAMASSKRSGHHGALMFMDLDNFKSLNDTHGHVAGDLLLQESARRISNCVREVDTVARFGGDEFVVVLSELDINRDESTTQARVVAEKICSALSAPHVLTIQHMGMADVVIEHHCTASIGVVLFINHEASQDDILKWADISMYQAKESGRNQIRFYKGT